MKLNSRKTLNIREYKIISFFTLFVTFSNIFFSHAIEYSGFGGKPAFPREDNPRTESIFIHTISPGETVDEGVRVINNTNSTKTFVVYSADYTKSTDGGFACKQYSQEKMGLGNWVILEKEEITIEAMSEETIPFVISVPEDAEVGEHNGCILIQEKKPPSESAGISISVRTGLRVAVTIPGEIIRKLSMGNILVIRKGLGLTTLNLSVKNTGNVSIDTDVKIKVSNLFKKEIISFGGQYPIFRDDEAFYNYDLKSPTFGAIYQAKGIATYDGNAGATIGDVSKVNSISIETRPVYFLVFPTLKGLMIIISSFLVVLLLLIKLFISKKRKKWIMKNWVQYKTRKNEDINFLASKFDVNWKILAKTNKLKAPYIIKSGDVLKVPPKRFGNKKPVTKAVDKVRKDSKEMKKPKKTSSKNNFQEKPKNNSKPKVKTNTKPKTVSRVKTTGNQKPPIEPQVDEISSIV